MKHQFRELLLANWATGNCSLTSLFFPHAQTERKGKMQSLLFGCFVLNQVTDAQATERVSLPSETECPGNKSGLEAYGCIGGTVRYRLQVLNKDVWCLWMSVFN